MDTVKKQCVFCERGSHIVPLISIEFQEQQLYICPQHMPVLIHNPAELVGKLPGAENLDPAEHKD
ncbi:MAG: hypothetical protein JXQ96_11255 [Cyclobacteriaceae bacterium]